MRLDPVEVFFKFLDTNNIVRIEIPEHTPFDNSPLSSEELAGLDHYGGFHGNKQSYRNFRRAFSASIDPSKHSVQLNVHAYKASLLFGSLEKFQGFYKKHGKQQNNCYLDPLMFFQKIRFPNNYSFKYVKFNLWGEFLNATGPTDAALHIFSAFGHSIAPPDHSKTGQRAKETIIQAAAKSKGKNIDFEDPSLKTLFELSLQYGLNLNEMSRAANYHFGARDCVGGRRAKLFPNIEIAGEEFGIVGGRFRRLPHDDPRLPFIGHFTGSCEKVSDVKNHIESSVKHAMERGLSTFYVVEDIDGQIIAHSWAWRGAHGALTFDGFESREQEFDSSHLIDLLNLLSFKDNSDTYNECNILRVFLGSCVEHLDPFNHLNFQYYHGFPRKYGIEHIKPHDIRTIGHRYNGIYLMQGDDIIPETLAR